MAAHDAEQYQREWASLLAFVQRWMKPPIRIASSGYDSENEDLSNAPRWLLWADGSVPRPWGAGEIVSTWNCPRCHAVLLRCLLVPRIVITLTAEQSVDGEPHRMQIHPGGLAMYGSRPTRVHDVRDHIQRRVTRGRAVARGADRHAMGWWVRDLPNLAKCTCWCMRCRRAVTFADLRSGILPL